MLSILNTEGKHIIIIIGLVVLFGLQITVTTNFS